MPMFIKCHRVPALPDHAVWQLATPWHEEITDIFPGKNQTWERVDADAVCISYLILLSQFADLYPCSYESEGVEQVWVKREEYRHAHAYPVILSSPIRNDGKGPQFSLQEWGKLGVVHAGISPSLYRLEQLDQESQKLQERFAQTLQELVSMSANTLWYEAVWSQAKVLAQCLAERYWSLHQQVHGSRELVPSVVAQQNTPTLPLSLVEEERTVRKRNLQRPAVLALVARDPVAVAVCNTPVALELTRLLLQETMFDTHPQYGVAELHVSFPNSSGGILLSLHQQADERWEDVEVLLSHLGDELVDTLCAVMAMAIDVHGANHLTDTVFFRVEDILQICQREKSNRAYVPQQRAKIVEHLRVLARIHIQLSGQLGISGIENRMRTPLIHLLSSTVGQYRHRSGDVFWERQAVKLGEWATLATPLSTQTAILMRTILKYHSQRERYAKRIGRRILLDFFSHARLGGEREEKAWLTYSLKEVLSLSGITPDLKHPDTTRTRIEGGIQRLVQDDILEGVAPVFNPIPSHSDLDSRLREHARGWWPSYLEQVRHFTPSSQLQTLYQSLV